MRCAWTIAMALSKIKTKPRGAERDATYRRMVAEQIVKHLKLSNWQFVKGPPLTNLGQPSNARGSRLALAPLSCLELMRVRIAAVETMTSASASEPNHLPLC